MVGCGSAIAFVRQHGSPIERARLDYLLTGEAPSLDLVSTLLAGQRNDGGWPAFWAPDASSLDATCFRLAQAAGLGLTAQAPALARAAEFLLRRRRDDGSWEEDASLVAVAPPRARPGNLAATLYLTANCGCWLALLMSRGHGPAVSGSGDYLARYLWGDGSLPSFPHTHWLAAGLWYRSGHRALANRVMRYLATSLVPTLPASNLGWLCASLLDVGIPREHPLLTQAADRLAHLQQPDGRWSSEDGPDRDVHATLEALRVLM